MTFVQHGVQGYILGKCAWLTTFWAVVFGIIGASPDLIGFLEKLISGNWDVWNWYIWAHTFQWWQVALPPYLLHIGVDKLTHFQESPFGWKEWTLPVEIILWVIQISWFIRNRIKYSLR